MIALKFYMLLFCFWICSIAAVHGGTLRTVALTGQPAPNATDGEVFSNLEVPVLNSFGQTAFHGVLAGVTVDDSNGPGIWSEGSGALGLVARAGNQAPGTPDGVNFGTFFLDSSLLLNAVGQTAFTALLTGDGVNSRNDAGIWSSGSGSLGLVAREGNHAPGTSSSVSFSRVGGPLGGKFALNDAGEVAFQSELVGVGVGPREGNSLGIWSERNGLLTLVARAGDQAPGSSAGVVFRAFRGPALNFQGQTAFFANLEGAGSLFDRGIWSEGSGSLALVAREGDDAPDTGDGVTFTTFFVSTPALNSAGQTAFNARLRGSDVTNTNDYGVWSESTGTLRLIALDGDVAPGLNGQEVFASERGNPFSVPKINSAGDTVFAASTDQSVGIWVNRSGSLDLVVSSVMTLPGLTDEESLRVTDQPALNAAGQVAFRALLLGNGINDANDEGIWAEDRRRELHLIARKGDLLEVGPGDFRTITDLRFIGSSGNDDGRRSAFNNRGQLAFQASFSDGTEGIFVSNLVAIFEPSDLRLLIKALIEDGVLNRGQGNSLLMKLNFNSNQQATLNRIKALINQINAFVNAGILTSVEGQSLIDVAGSLRDNLSAAGDFNASGDLNGADFLKWQRDDRSTAGLTLWEDNYGTNTSSTSAALQNIPEPSSFALIMLCSCSLLSRRQLSRF